MWTGDWKVKGPHYSVTACTKACTPPDSTVLDCLQAAVWNLVRLESPNRSPEIQLFQLAFCRPELFMSFTPLEDGEGHRVSWMGKFALIFIMVSFQRIPFLHNLMSSWWLSKQSGGSGLPETEFYQSSTEFCLWNQKPFPGTAKFTGEKITFQVHTGSCNTWMDEWVDHTQTYTFTHTLTHTYTYTHTSAMQIWEKEVGSQQVGTCFPWHSIRCSGLHATPHTATSLPSRPPPEHSDDSWSQCSSCCQSLPVASLCGTLGKKCWGLQRGRWAGHRGWCGSCLGGCFRVAMSALSRMGL